MCGITGFVTSEESNDGRTLVERMSACIDHRGPDGNGVYCDAGVFLGHQRLSIIDVSAGRQPMSNESGEIWITYNGEIYNHADLRPELEQAGHRYKTRCDTETIIHAYEEYGPQCLSRFRGMFAFALWDQRTRTLFCARDRLGIKPFYYFWDGRLFAFASEIKALLQHPAISATLHESLLPEYLAFGYTSGEETLFEGVRKLMPGHHLSLCLEGERPKLEIRQYWDPPRASANEPQSDELWIRDCRRRLEETVRMRLMSDVPLGMFLSGGVDSSAIAALMKRMTSGPVKTFSVGYQEAAFSELTFASHVAAALGTDHHEVKIGMEDLFNALPNLIWHEDEPITWPSSVSLYFVAQLAARQVKVVLTGEGSDELYAGYERYSHYVFNRKWMSFYHLFPAPFRNGLRSQLTHSPLLSASLRRKLRHTFLGREDTLESLQLDNFYCAFPAAEQQRLFHRDIFNPAGPYRNFRRYWDSAAQSSMLGRMLYADQKTYLVELLMKQDQMSMACSIESRVPFLDHTFVEFAARVPDHLKIRNGVRKYILKKAVEDLLPAEIIHRKKMGFPTPIRRWLLEERATGLYSILRDRDGLLATYLDRNEIERLLTRHQGGVEDATDRIWRLLNLQLWGDIFLAGKRDRWSDGLLLQRSAACNT